MSALDFLANNTNPTAATGYSQSQTALPPWYQAYTNNILTRATQFANEPYTPYQGPRIASATPLTNDAYTNATGLASGTAHTQDTAQNLITSAGKNPTAFQAANPYLQAAAAPTYSNVDKYMNPYNRAVTDEIARLGNRNFTENVLPALNDQFVGAGNILGSTTRSAELAERAARDNQATILGQQANVLQSGFGQAQNAAGADASRMAGLAGTAGNLQDTSTRTTAGLGTDLSNANAQGINSKTTALNAQNILGQQQQQQTQNNYNLAYQDFLNQKNYPMQQVAALQTGLQGIQVPTATQSYNYGSQTGDGASVLGQLGGLFQNYLTGNG